MSLYDTTIGTLLVGIFFNTLLYGFVTHQFVIYHSTKFNDPPMTRYMVLFLFILDTFHSTSVIYMAWDYTVANHDKPIALAVAEWPYSLTPLATVLAALVTQIYLGFRKAYQIWRLTRSKFLYGVVILLAIPSFMMGIVTSIEAWIIKVLSNFSRLVPFAVSWLSMQVTVDIFITITLVIAFSRARTGFYKTDTILNRFIRGAIQTGFFASMFSLGDLITHVLFPRTNLFVMFAIPLGRIYTNTLMDNLLCRRLIVVNMDTDRTFATTGNPEFESVFWAPTDSQAIPII